MIKSFGSRETEKIYQGECVAKLLLEIQKIGLKDLLILSSNKFEKLKGNLKDYYSIRINNQWRIIFKWIDDHATNVEIVDHH